NAPGQPAVAVHAGGVDREPVDATLWGEKLQPRARRFVVDSSPELAPRGRPSRFWSTRSQRAFGARVNHGHGSLTVSTKRGQSGTRALAPPLASGKIRTM